MRICGALRHLEAGGAELVLNLRTAQEPVDRDV